MVVRVGTASWTDKTLIACGRFYPRDAKTAEARLRYYASQFPIVEVDSSYYAMPSPATTQLWAERTPEGFVMNIKAFRLFTGHQTSPQVLHRDIQLAIAGLAANRRFLYTRDLPPEIVDELWRRFHEALLPLKLSGRLGLVHFQFPPWVVNDRSGRALIEQCVERMAGHVVGVEFRHKSWFEGTHREATMALQRELGVVHTIVDGPQGFNNSVPAVWESTHPGFALLRLHGRNTATWDVKGATAASDRFNYDYAEAELAALAGRLEPLARVVPHTYVIFNNNMEDQGQRNARTMMALIESAEWMLDAG